MKMKLSELNQIVNSYEARMAPGSQTAMLGDYNERMRQVTGLEGTCCGDSDAEVPADEADYWQRVYAAYEANPEQELQVIYDTI